MASLRGGVLLDRNNPPTAATDIIRCKKRLVDLAQTREATCPCTVRASCSIEGRRQESSFCWSILVALFGPSGTLNHGRFQRANTVGTRMRGRRPAGNSRKNSAYLALPVT